MLHLLHQSLNQLCLTVKNIQSIAKQYPVRLENYLQTFGIKLQSADKFIFPFLIQIDSNCECNFYIEEYIRDMGFERGLWGQQINEVLCRDLFRRTFILWKIVFPPHFLESFQKMLFTLIGQEHTIMVRISHMIHV